MAKAPKGASKAKKQVKDLTPKAGQVKGGRSSAEKRLETQRRDLTRNWAG